jgi:acetoacetate decarboxylase
VADGGQAAQRREAGTHTMRKEEVLQLPSMPAAGPSYPAGPYRFIDREFLVITYETDPELIREQLPEPLEAIEQPLVHYEWIKMPDSSGFGSYTESGMVIPARLRGEEVNFVAQMYLDDDPPIAAGREIWGFPKKYAHPTLEIVKDTLTGTLSYAGQLVAMGTMGYKHESMAGNGERTRATLSKTQINLKLIPGVTGHPEICQLVAINLTDIVVKGSWIGPGRLHLVPHVNAPVADLPVRRIVGAHHFLADLTLPYGRVVYDYNKQQAGFCRPPALKRKEDRIRQVAPIRRHQSYPLCSATSQYGLAASYRTLK